MNGHLNQSWARWQQNSAAYSKCEWNGTEPASKTNRGQFKDREYTTEETYSGSDQDSDSREEEKERSEREVVHESVPTSGGLSYTSGSAV